MSMCGEETGYIRVTKTMCGADCWTDHTVTKPKNPDCEATSRQGSSRETGCLIAESRQHETNFLNGLDAINLTFEEQKKTVFHKRFIRQLQLLYDIHLANIKTGWTIMLTKFRGF